MNQIEDFIEEDGVENGDLFNCEYTSIDAVINKIKVFTGATVKETENGNRCLVAYATDPGSDDPDPPSAFFTESKRIKDVVLADNRTFPFRAIIKVVRFGENTGFKFFPPSCPITRDDLDNFNYYQKNKYRKR